MNFLKKLKNLFFGDTKKKIVESNDLETVVDICDWAVNRIDQLHGKDAKAVISEFDEWINVPEQVEEIEYLYIDSEGWTEDQEVDVR